MTFPEVLTIGKACLEEYQPRLKKQMKEKRPFSDVALMKTRSLDCWLSHVTKDEIKRVSEEVLEELVGLKDGFVLSDPHPGPKTAEHKTVCHNGFYLWFTCTYDQTTYSEVLRVACWYYPA